jgi:FG-GAP repeat
MVVAAPEADVAGVETSGAAYVFVRDPTGGQWLEHQHLLPADGDFGDSFLDLTLAVQGDTIVVGAPYTTMQDFQEGVVYVFERDRGGPGVWGEVAQLSDVNVDDGGHFGSSVALEGDLLVVGAAQDSSARNGWVRIFERDRGGADNWGQVTTLAHTAVGDAGHPRSFGSAVAIEGDLLVVGASRTSVSWIGRFDGAAYLFRRGPTDADRWDYVTRLIVPRADQCVGGLTVSQFLVQASVEEREAAAACAIENPTSGAFGHRVALDGDTMVITARFAHAEDGTSSTGKAHVYRRDASDDALWHYVTPLSGSGASAFAYFGSALALAGDVVLIGAPGTTIDTRQRQGAAYLFERAAGGPDAWGEVAKLTASDGLSEGSFGSAVALDGAARIIGAKGDNANRGAIYIQAPAAPPEEPSGLAFEPTGELVDGGIVEDASGVLLRAASNTLPAPLGVWIHEVEAPAEQLPPEATAHGSFYNVGAVETTIATSEGTFALALPVPEGADPAHIAVAVLVPADRQTEGAEPEDLWLPVTGVYDPDQGLFSIALDVLERTGETFVLMERTDAAALAGGGPVRGPMLRLQECFRLFRRGRGEIRALLAGGLRPVCRRRLQRAEALEQDRDRQDGRRRQQAHRENRELGLLRQQNQ